MHQNGIQTEQQYDLLSPGTCTKLHYSSETGMHGGAPDVDEGVADGSQSCPPLGVAASVQQQQILSLEIKLNNV